MGDVNIRVWNAANLLLEMLLANPGSSDNWCQVVNGVLYIDTTTRKLLQRRGCLAVWVDDYLMRRVWQPGAWEYLASHDTMPDRLTLMWLLEHDKTLAYAMADEGVKGLSKAFTTAIRLQLRRFIENIYGDLDRPATGAALRFLLRILRYQSENTGLLVGKEAGRTIIVAFHTALDRIEEGDDIFAFVKKAYGIIEKLESRKR